MNEEIRKNEISEAALENVAGGTGTATSIPCPKCGGEMIGTAALPGNTGKIPKYICLTCGHGEW